MRFRIKKTEIVVEQKVYYELRTKYYFEATENVIWFGFIKLRKGHQIFSTEGGALNYLEERTRGKYFPTDRFVLEIKRIVI